MPVDNGRQISHVATPFETTEGAGVSVRRALPAEDLPYAAVDPFLLLDDFTTTPGGPGIPEHPHRGQEIITYVLEGKVKHSDSQGNRAIAHAGGLQRITAGAGIRHEEGPIEGEMDPVRGLQLWINMALADKTANPSYQNFETHQLPRETHDGSTVKTLVGEGSPTTLHNDMTYLDVDMDAGAEFNRDLSVEWQGFVYVLVGEAEFGANQRQAGSGTLLVLGQGSAFRAMAGNNGARFMLAAGQPHREPVRWRGPYVD